MRIEHQESKLPTRIYKVLTKSSRETQELAGKLTPLLRSGDVLSLTGDLGAGKTCFTHGLARGLGIEKKITSPTFNLIKEYKNAFSLYHFDVYRLQSLTELMELGYEEYFYGDGVTVIEWGDKIAPLLPPAYLEIEFRRLLEENLREVHIIPRGGDWDERVGRWLS
ncbi:MAG: tRNA (adenosine(37)-N6)-threonylcarbamoyltransferase complex ATPase subunit type 1 TsaE [Actinomycetota bacterium]|nr:tRNA (adenosine(37)-N6)-threonylcarbamoyltransferase complex ATPase subunit type 1 TsaE [Actinomycetota bacterium]